ncbi:MAG: Ig-like domain-containing protein, partial [Planctomycetota bacterium]
DSLALDGGVFLAGASFDGTVNFQQGAVYAYVENTVPTLLDQVFSVPEDDAGTQPFATVSAFDAESFVTFAVIGGSGASDFLLDSTTGALLSTGDLDFETTASYDLMITATDGSGAVTTAQVTIAVTDVDDAPQAQDPNFAEPALGGPLSEDVPRSWQLGDTVPLDLFATDVDSPLDSESLTFDSAIVTIDALPTVFHDLAAVGVSYDPLTGELTVDPSGIPLFQSLSVGQTAVLAVDFTVTTGALSDTGVATFAISGANDAPVALESQLGPVADEDSVWLRQIGVDLDLTSLATDVDTELGPVSISWDAIDVTIDGATTSVTDLAAVGFSYDTVSGELRLDPTGIPLFQGLAATQTADLSFLFTVDDGELNDTGVLSLSLVGQNDTPLAIDDQITLTEDGIGLLDVLANDEDVDASAVLHITMTTPPLHGSVMLVANQIEYLPEPDFFGTDAYGYVIEDEFGASSSAVVQVTVTEINDAPIAMLDEITTTADTEVTISVLANDLPGPANEAMQTLTVIATADPLQGTVTLNSDGTLTYTPSVGFTGQDSFTYTVEDNGLTQGVADPRQATGTVQVFVEPVLPPGDFDQDTAFTCADINLLSAAIATASNDLSFDLNDDGQLDNDDLLAWLANAGAVNRPSQAAYLMGDANLDGLVDGLDFVIWNNNKFTDTTDFCSGDFNASGRVDGADFLRWNDHKFMNPAGGLQTQPPALETASRGSSGVALTQAPQAPVLGLTPSVPRPSSATVTDDVMRMIYHTRKELEDLACRDEAFQVLGGDSLLQFPQP